MRPVPAALALGLVLAGALPTQAAWMTFVLRDVATSARIGMGARVYNENQDPVLSIVCTPDGLGAMFDTGFVVPGEAIIDALPSALLIGADGGALDPFPVTLEPYNRSDRMEMRLVVDPGEAIGLAEYVLGATGTIQVGYRMNDADVMISFDNDSAPISIGAVLSECAGRDRKTK